MKQLFAFTLCVLISGAASAQAQELQGAKPAANTTNLTIESVLRSVDVDRAWNSVIAKIEKGEIALNIQKNTVVSTALTGTKALGKELRLDLQFTYNEQAIGGVLTVGVYVRPAFAGIGISNRPIFKQITSMAVDQFDAATVASVLEDAKSELDVNKSIASN